MTRPLRPREVLIGRDEHGGLVIGGSQIFTGSAPALVSKITSLLTHIRNPEYIMTLNVDQLLQLRKNTKLFSSFQSASLRTVDGMPLKWVARLVGVRNAHRNTGADLLYELCSEGSRRNWTIAVTGGPSGRPTAAAANLGAKYPSLNVFGVEFPFINDPSDAKSLRVVNEFKRIKPDIVFICLGCPKQELWFSEWSDRLEPAVYVGAGAAVDFAAGAVTRAPAGMQRAGFEWLWRLCKDPRRLFRRYLVEGPKFLGVVLDSVRFRNRGVS